MNDFPKTLRGLEVCEVFEGQNNTKGFVFDFSESNTELSSIDLNDQEQFEKYITAAIQSSLSDYGIGQYAENRVLYRRFGLFESNDSRSFHLGIDFWLNAGTAISSPLNGIVHSFNNNNNAGDYGPTIILKHEYDGMVFHTLYGHLSRESLLNLKVGDEIKAGQPFCNLGEWHENVYWPPHLHFQLIRDMGSMKGDFPGVCNYEDRAKWMENCPDPNLLLRINTGH